MTALTGLVDHRDALWVASTMSDEDAEASREHDGGCSTARSRTPSYRVRLVECDPDAYDRFYNVVANPMLWFIQHYLWDLSNAPDIRRHEVEAYEHGYCAVNDDLARAVLEEVEGEDEAVVMLHDYHLYTAPRRSSGASGRTSSSTTSSTSRGPSRTPGGCCRATCARTSSRASSRTTSSPSTRAPTAATSCSAAASCSTSRSTRRPGVVQIDGPRGVGARLPAADLGGHVQRTAQRPAVHEYEREILRRRREHLLLRVDRADLSKNVLRGFTAFDLFLEQHPEFLEQVTFIAHLIPSRQDVPEYAEYLEKIEALVAVVNHRHGTTDWMPIDLRLRENLEEAIAAYKHYDLLIVNAMFDGMNLVAKEGPLVNERHGVSLLSENTGAHEELGEFSLSVNPFDVQEQADAIHRALTMSAEERSWRAEGLKKIVTARDPGDWVDDQLADIEAKRAGRASVKT